MNPWGLALVASVALLATFDVSLLDPDTALMTPEGSEPADKLLEGTWLREYDDKGTRARRVLVLEADGTFRENVRVTGQTGAVTEYMHAGTWIWDGTNLKRKYTLMDGEPPSRLRPPFATFEIRFESRDEFTGLDRVKGNRIHYRRVAAGTRA